MDFTNAVICILFSTLAISYAWGMRGAVIGGEKGAMLPGVFIGLILAWFSGGGIRESFWIPAAAGLMGMTFGGIEPYGETIGTVLHRGRPDYRPVKGYIGLAFKGALWFSLSGGFIAISFTAMSGSVYSAADIIIFCLLIPVVQQIGYRIFNCPYDKDKKIYPRIFFSLTRREEWGSNFALLIAMIAMTVIKGDDFSLTMIAGGFFFGAVGWLIAMRLYVLSAFPLRNGKYIFGKLQEKNLIDGWKIMEFTLGAVGGFGLSLIFCLNYRFIDEYNSLISQNGRWIPIEPIESAMPYVAALLAVLVFSINIYQFICDKNGKKLNYFICDQIERPLYNVIPMLFVLLGSEFTARIMTVFMLVLVCVIKCVFDRFDSMKSLPLWQVVSVMACVAVFIGDIILGGYSPFSIIIAGTAPYLIAEFIWAVSRKARKDKTVKHQLTQTSFLTVYSFFIIQSIVILTAAFKIFNI